jgi:hypothetical protein
MVNVWRWEWTDGRVTAADVVNPLMMREPVLKGGWYSDAMKCRLRGSLTDFNISITATHLESKPVYSHGWYAWKMIVSIRPDTKRTRT